MSKSYDTSRLSVKQKRDLMLAAKKVCERWWVDYLDCTVSIRRQKIDMPFKKALKKLKQGCHFTVIHRDRCEENYIEVCFNTMTIKEPTTFLWIIVPVEHVSLFSHLKKMQ